MQPYLGPPAAVDVLLPHLCAGKDWLPATSSTSDSSSLKQKLLKSNAGTSALLGAAATAAASAEAPGVLASCTAGVAAVRALASAAAVPVLGVPTARALRRQHNQPNA
jgi:hypothetical protein